MMAKDPLEPDAATSGTSGSEGAGSWQHDPATRLPEETDIGSSLRKVRKRRGLTQRGLADISGVSLSLIRKLEQGEIADT